MKQFLYRCLTVLSGLVLIGALAGCSSSGKRPDETVSCTAPLSQRLALAMDEAKMRLGSGCRKDYASLFEQLLEIGEGDPGPENKRAFSDYLLWASDKGYISPLQAKQTYTRYFGVKFVTALSDYNTCAAVCPTQTRILSDMRTELGDKARGMMEVAADREGYSRASALFGEMELILSATCSACAKQ